MSSISVSAQIVAFDGGSLVPATYLRYGEVAEFEEAFGERV
jgi:hypothetical protein